ncbi:hypothetical protein JCM8097_001353 [Rhodosporidiobolus ruineniae]
MPTLLRNPLALVFSLLSLLVLTTGVHGQAQINSPASVTTCLPQQLTVSGGEAPYTIQVLPGGATGGQPLETLPQLDQAGSVRWVADVEPGQSITFAVRDNTGAVNFSAQVPVLAGSSTDCIGSNASSGTGTPTTTSGGASETASGDLTSSGASSASGSTSGSTSARTTGSASSASRSGTSTSASASASQSGNSNAGSKFGAGSGLVLVALTLVVALA